MPETPLQRIFGGIGPAGYGASPDAPVGLRIESDPARGARLGVADAFGHWLARRGSLMAALAGRPMFETALHGAANPAERLLEEFLSHGAAALERIKGSFSVAVLDSAARYALIAVDRMGIEAMAYASSPIGIAFGTRADAVAAALGRTADIDAQAVLDYLFFHMVPAPETIYRNVHKLLPAQFIEYRDGSLRIGHYWRMQYADEARVPQSRLAQRFRELLPRAVARQLDAQPAGTFLSGGTDSSSVTGILAGLQREPVDAYSIGFHANGFDEMEYARLAARRYGVRHHAHYVTAGDVVASVPRVAEAYDEPFGNASAVAVYHCAMRARDAGTRVMLAGDGGDELFGGNARYRKQQAFEAYRLLPAGLRAGVLEPLALRLPALQRLAPARKLRSYIEQANIPLPDRLESYNFLMRSDLRAMLMPDFLASIRPDHPLELMREVYERTQSSSAINRMMHLDLKQTLSDNDLRKVNVMCRLAGIDVRYPMLDDEVVAFSAEVPPSGKVGGLRLRPFFKKALAGLLPPEILAKTKHGFGVPFGLWMLEHRALRELAGDSLSAFRSRGYLRAEYLDRLLEQHRGGHASYYGVMVWVIMMLEQWFQARRSASAPSLPRSRTAAG